MTLFSERIARAVRTDDNIFWTDSSSRSNGISARSNVYRTDSKRLSVRKRLIVRNVFAWEVTYANTHGMATSRFVEYMKNKNALPKSRAWNLTQKIIQLVQGQHFPEEIDSLSSRLKSKVTGNSKLANLSPVLIEGTVCIGGRIWCRPSNAPSEGSSYPLLKSVLLSQDFRPCWSWAGTLCHMPEI